MHCIKIKNIMATTISTPALTLSEAAISDLSAVCTYKKYAGQGKTWAEIALNDYGYFSWCLENANKPFVNLISCINKSNQAFFKANKYTLGALMGKNSTVWINGVRIEAKIIRNRGMRRMIDCSDQIDEVIKMRKGPKHIILFTGSESETKSSKYLIGGQYVKNLQESIQESIKAQFES